jgi:PilZ domain
VTDSLASSDPGAQKRRSTRITQAVPITVTGVDALGQPFKERTTTVMVNCHGCKYQSKHYVPKNSVVKLEVPRQEAGLPARSITGRVIWVQRPRTVRELFQIGLEF